MHHVIANVVSSESQSDGANFDNPNFKTGLEGNVLNVPSECVILRDDAFPFKIISYNAIYLPNIIICIENRKFILIDAAVLDAQWKIHLTYSLIDFTYSAKTSENRKCFFVVDTIE